jgi:hypothetical protein
LLLKNGDCSRIWGPGLVRPGRLQPGREAEAEASRQQGGQNHNNLAQLIYAAARFGEIVWLRALRWMVPEGGLCGEL